MSACERAFCWQRGLLLLTLFARRSLPLNAVVCSAAIGSCEKAQLQLAMEHARGLQSLWCGGGFLDIMGQVRSSHFLRLGGPQLVTARP